MSDETDGVKSLDSNDAGEGIGKAARITGGTFLPYRPYRKEGQNNEKRVNYGSKNDRIGLYQWEDPFSR